MPETAQAVLLLEDDEDIARLFARLISSYGVEAVVCADQEAVLRAVEEKPIALALLDIMLPDADGRLVAKTLRERKVPFPIYFMTGVRERDIGEDYCRMADGILRKPFAINVLRDLLEKVLHESDAAEAPSPDTREEGEENAPTARRQVLELLTTLASDQETLRRQQGELQTLIHQLEASSAKEDHRLAEHYREFGLGLEACLGRLSRRVEQIADLLYQYEPR